MTKIVRKRHLCNFISDVDRVVSDAYDKKYKENSITERILEEAIGGHNLEALKERVEKNGKMPPPNVISCCEKFAKYFLLYQKNSMGVSEQLFSDILFIRIGVDDINRFLSNLGDMDEKNLGRLVDDNSDVHFVEAKKVENSYVDKSESNRRQFFKFYEFYSPNGWCPVHWIYQNSGLRVSLYTQHAYKRNGCLCSRTGYSYESYERLELWSGAYWMDFFGFKEYCNGDKGNVCRFGFSKVYVPQGAFGKVRDIVSRILGGKSNFMIILFF